MADHQQTQQKGRTAPDPDDPRKPDDPPDLHKPTLKYVLRRTLREFSKDQCTDLAAALVYFAVLALFPALIALVSLLGLVGQGGAVTDVVGQVVGAVADQDTTDTVTRTVGNFVDSQSGTAVGLGLVIGLVGALWSASGYVGAFSRAMNRVYEVEEGRPVWKLRPVMLLVTLVALLLLAVALVIVVVSGPVAEAVGDVVGLGSTAVTVWSIAKWPVLAGVVVLVIALLYWATPNVQQPKFRWVSLGSVVAIVVWLVASVGFAVYVTNFSSYDATYGALAGVVVFLLWLWITNIALLLGAEVDAEVERGRELQAGIAAEESVQLPPRDTRASDKKAAAEAKDVDRGWALRVGAEQDRAEGDDRRGGTDR
ncbi:YihY/virulence factor BrkB family protein [Pseudokineococcus lusitanus]|uniref:Membrane protein n=1 Tax=Pseudokineococcus lusitanus TaxID=763993 RepID=A0A3N1HQZ8_9ACTN|nr:YihY/virulence factor BrkB family protein [Pseudokineococcus lusitanus]ROP44934.1 membrane protein [Pseudokineococcus lusitanus]